MDLRARLVAMGSINQSLVVLHTLNVILDNRFSYTGCHMQGCASTERRAQGTLDEVCCARKGTILNNEDTGLLWAVDRGFVQCGVAHGGGARGVQAAAGPPAWLLRAAAAQGLPLQSLGALRAPPGVDRLLARSGKRLREGVPPSFT